MSNKIEWRGSIVSIQPRTRVWRYLTDNRTHYHLGYNLFLDGSVNGTERSFVVAISEKQQISNSFNIGDEVQGIAWEKEYPEREFADYYKAGAFKHINRSTERTEVHPPPWIVALPNMKTYEDRGARMLCKSRRKSKCFLCIWATMSNKPLRKLP